MSELNLSLPVNRVTIGGQAVNVYTERSFIDIGQAKPINSSYRVKRFCQGNIYFQSTSVPLVPESGIAIWHIPIVKYKSWRAMGIIIASGASTHLVTPNDLRLKVCSFLQLENLIKEYSSSTISAFITNGIAPLQDYTDSLSLTEDNTYKPTEVIYVVTPPTTTRVFEVEIEAYSVL